MAVKTNYYEVLGVKSSANDDEIQRAYRVLARRYHPDVNPGASSEDKFKGIAEAYRILKDPKERRKFDLLLDQQNSQYYRNKLKNYSDQAKKQYQKGKPGYQRTNTTKQTTQRKSTPKSRPKKTNDNIAVEKALRNVGASLRAKLSSPFSFIKKKKEAPPGSHPVSSISLIEISLSVEEAISGIKKTIEVSAPESSRKVSVHIPAGSRTGSVIRLRNKKKGDEELVLIVQLARHPFLSIERKGPVIELPITVEEALRGASISVPTLADQVLLKIPAGSQSGEYLRLSQQGIQTKDGDRGDLFYRLFIRNPEPPESVGLGEKVQELTPYYSQSVRSHLPKRIGAN